MVMSNRLVVVDGVLPVRSPARSSAGPPSSRRSRPWPPRRGSRPGAALAVGDGANDADMVRAAGLGVAFHAKPALAEAADAVLRHSDLTALLALQGIPESEWSN